MSVKFDARKLAVLHKQLKNLRVSLDELNAPNEIKDSADRLIMYYSSDKDKEDNHAR